MRILRTIESFLPYISGPGNQAFEISKRLEQRGIHSPILTSYLNVDRSLPPRAVYNGVTVRRCPVWFKVMRYAPSPGMIPYLREFDLLHSHNYRNFQTDCAFFLPVCAANPSS